MAVKVCMGNEAIALGALAAGVKVAAGYPGTPSTEIIETLIAVHHPDVKVQWSTNEKVALEVAAGAAYAGARTLCTMKQVGLNVASDPLMSLAYIGIKGGMVIAVADDPGPWSSQTEQDTRNFAKHANLPVFDPSSPEEAYEMVQAAYELSEAFALPVFLRPTTRVCHASADVDVREEITIREAEGFNKRPEWCIFPALSYRRHGELEVKQNELARAFDTMPFNRVERGGASRKGVAVSGVSYLYAKEVIGELGLDVVLYKVGTPYPLPEKTTRDFLNEVDSVLVIEELDPVVEEQLLIAAAGKRPILGKRSGHMPWNGEYSFELIKKALLSYLGIEAKEAEAETLPPLPVRPPVLCAGCPHRASFYEAKVATKDCEKAIYCGDIGCYTLGMVPPLRAADFLFCMGSSVSAGSGFAMVSDRPVVGFIGDSTFFHSGMTGLANAVFNKHDVLLVILDNGTTAMTGHQPNPGVCTSVLGEGCNHLDIESVVRGIGVTDVAKVKPFNMRGTLKTIEEMKARSGVRVIIAEEPCMLFARRTLKQNRPQVAEVATQGEEALKCLAELACPAFRRGGTAEAPVVSVDESQCSGCMVCLQVTPAIRARKRS